MRIAVALALPVMAIACSRAPRSVPDAGPNATGLHRREDVEIFGVGAARTLPPFPPDELAWLQPRPDVYDGVRPTWVPGLEGVLRLEVTLPSDTNAFSPTMYRLGQLVHPDLETAFYRDPWVTDDGVSPEIHVDGRRFYTSFPTGHDDLREIVEFMNDTMRELDRPRRLLILADGSVVGGRGDILARAVAEGRLVPAQPR